jgi:poly-gamma-glutamate system protein
MSAFAARRPRAAAKVRPAWLALFAAVSVATWLAVELTTQRVTHPRFAEMLAAARTMQAASRVLVQEKETRGLMAPPDADPNRTGMIGPEYTPITTTLGDLSSKRTTTNPDFAAALVRLIATLDLPRGAPVVVVLSGSFVGGNVAAIAAVEALGLKPVVVVSMSASMWGANDPDFNWLDMVAALRTRGVIRSSTAAAVLGGDGAIGGSIEPDAVAAMRAAAARDHVPVIEVRPLAALIDALYAQVQAALGGEKPGAVINVGGAVIGLGNCRESYEATPGLTKRPPPCTGGTPGLALRLAADGAPMLHVINIRRLAVEFGLPFDPVPLPSPGDNRAIYGGGSDAQ